MVRPRVSELRARPPPHTIDSHRPIYEIPLTKSKQHMAHMKLLENASPFCCGNLEAFLQFSLVPCLAT